jgi:hypothetical protein
VRSKHWELRIYGPDGLYSTKNWGAICTVRALFGDAFLNSIYPINTAQPVTCRVHIVRFRSLFRTNVAVCNNNLRDYRTERLEAREARPAGIAQWTVG